MKFQKFLTILVILILFWNVNSRFAIAEEVVFQDIYKVSEDLQRCSNTEKLNTLLNEKIIILNDEKKNCEDIVLNQDTSISNLNNQIENSKVQIDNLNNSTKELINIIEEQKIICDIRIKNCKPTFMEKVKNNSSYTALGIILGVILSIL